MRVRPGIEVLLEKRLDLIRGTRVGVVVHPASVLLLDQLDIVQSEVEVDRPVGVYSYFVLAFLIPFGACILFQVVQRYGPENHHPEDVLSRPLTNETVRGQVSHCHGKPRLRAGTNIVMVPDSPATKISSPPRSGRKSPTVTA